MAFSDHVFQAFGKGVDLLAKTADRHYNRPSWQGQVAHVLCKALNRMYDGTSRGKSALAPYALTEAKNSATQRKKARQAKQNANDDFDFSGDRNARHGNPSDSGGFDTGGDSAESRRRDRIRKRVHPEEFADNDGEDAEDKGNKGTESAGDQPNTESKGKKGAKDTGAEDDVVPDGDIADKVAEDADGLHKPESASSAVEQAQSTRHNVLAPKPHFKYRQDGSAFLGINDFLTGHGTVFGFDPKWIEEGEYQLIDPDNPNQPDLYVDTADHYRVYLADQDIYDGTYKVDSEKVESELLGRFKIMMPELSLDKAMLIVSALYYCTTNKMVQVAEG